MLSAGFGMLNTVFGMLAADSRILTASSPVLDTKTPCFLACPAKIFCFLTSGARTITIYAETGPDSNCHLMVRVLR